MWGVANLGWMYYEVALHGEPPTTSAYDLLRFGKRADRHGLVPGPGQGFSCGSTPESALDFLRVGIVLFFIYAEYYYFPAHRLTTTPHSCGRCASENVEDALLTVLAAFQGAARGAAYSETLRRPRYSTCCSYPVRRRWPNTCKVIRSPPQRGHCGTCYGPCRFSAAAMWAAQWRPSPAAVTASLCGGRRPAN